MLNLTLREEFRGNRLKGTAIELSNDKNTGATQMAAEAFLQITYPTRDLLKGIEAVGPDQGRPGGGIGGRGRWVGRCFCRSRIRPAICSKGSRRSARTRAVRWW